MAALVDSDKGSGTLNAFRSGTCGPRDVVPEVPSPPHAVEVRVFLKGLESLSQKFCCDWPALSSFREAVSRRGGLPFLLVNLSQDCCSSVAPSYPTLQG